MATQTEIRRAFDLFLPHAHYSYSPRDIVERFLHSFPEYSAAVYNRIEHYLALAYAHVVKRSHLTTE